jgi:hypothetical protein
MNLRFKGKYYIFVKVWEDNWDDDNVDSDFAKHLRQELENQGLVEKK